MQIDGKIVYCPNCGRRVTHWDGRTTTPIAGYCRNCWRQVVYYPDNDETVIKKIPGRNTSSGMTFR